MLLPPKRLLNSQAFGLVKRVLAGEERFDLDAGSSRVMQLLFSSDTDCTATQESLFIHFGPKKQRHPNTYYRRAAPRILSEILSRASVPQVKKPIVLGLPSGEVARRERFAAWSYASKLVWIVPDADSVRIFVRESPNAWVAPYAGIVPTRGPLSITELPDPSGSSF